MYEARASSKISSAIALVMNINDGIIIHINRTDMPTVALAYVENSSY